MSEKKGPAAGGGAGENKNQQDHIPSLAYLQDQLRRFVACLFILGDIIEVRLLPSGRSNWYVAGELSQLAEVLIGYYRSGQQLFIGVHPRTAKGNGSSAATCIDKGPCGKCGGCVKFARVAFVDIDNNITVAEALSRLRESGLPAPTLIVASGGGVHFYWRFEQPMEDLDRWSLIQKGLIALLGADTSVHDRSRIMRIPGWPNTKYTPARPCKIVESHPDHTYPVEEFAHLEARVVEPPQLADSCDGDDKILEGKRNNTLRRLGCGMRGRGHSPSEIEAALLVRNRERCKPPLPKDEVVGIAKRAGQYEPNRRVNDTVGGESAWSEPIPFGVYDVPKFPLDAIPERLASLREFCEGVAESFQVPTDAVFMLTLAVAGAALAKRIEVLVKADWPEPVNMFVVVAMLSGERKSAVFRVVAAPLAAFEREENTRLAPLIERNKNERAILEAKLKRAQNDAVKAKGAYDTLAAPVNVHAIAEKLRNMEELRPLQLVADDATPEAVSQLLSEQGGRVALLSPEGDVFDLMAGRYSDGNSRLGAYLKGHAGDDIRVNRVGRAAEYVRRPALSVGLAVQPGVLHGLLEKPQLRDRGLLARFLYSLPVSRVGYRDLQPAAVPERVTAAYVRLIYAALQLEPATDAKGEPCPHVVRVSPEALAELNRFRAVVETQLRPDGELAGLRDWGSKLPGAVCRIAGVFHGLMHPGEPSAEPIDAETMLGAIGVGEYLIEHALAAFGLMGSDPATALARRLLDWLKESRLTEFTRHDAHRKTRVKRVAELDPPLALLAENGYIRRQHTERTGPGRPPSPAFDVNPTWAGQNGQNGQNPDPENIMSVVSHVSEGGES